MLYFVIPSYLICCFHQCSIRATPGLPIDAGSWIEYSALRQPSSAFLNCKHHATCGNMRKATNISLFMPWTSLDCRGVMWPGVEPHRGVYNESYLSIVREIVEEASKRQPAMFCPYLSIFLGRQPHMGSTFWLICTRRPG